MPANQDPSLIPPRIVPATPVARAAIAKPNETEGEPREAGPLGAIRLTASERVFLDSALVDMTQRERDVIYALCAGGTNETMAHRLGIALPTLRTHLMRLNQKLRTGSKSDVVRHVASLLLEGYRTGTIDNDQL